MSNDVESDSTESPICAYESSMLMRFFHAHARGPSKVDGKSRDRHPHMRMGFFLRSHDKCKLKTVAALLYF